MVMQSGKDSLTQGGLVAVKELELFSTVREKFVAMPGRVDSWISRTCFACDGTVVRRLICSAQL